MSSNTHKTVKGLSSQAIITIVLGILEIVSFSIMSRLLTKEDFGLFAVVSAIVSVFSSISESGLGASLVQRKVLNKRFIDNVFTLSLIMGLLLSVLLVLLSGFLSAAVLGEGLRLALILMSISLFMNSLSSVNLSLLQRDYRFITIGSIQIIALVISTLVAVTLALKTYGFYSIIAKVILTPTIIYVISFFCVKRKFSLKLDKANFKDILNFSGWFMGSRLLRNLSKQLDKLLMPKLIGIETLGAYSRPKEFLDQISTKINGIFDTALFPVLSSIQDDNMRLRASLSKSLYFLNLFSTFISLAFIFNSRLIIRIFFGQNWLDLVPVFIILAIAVVFNADGRLADCYFRSLGRTKQQFYFRIGELLSKFFGVIIGMHWGLIGIAIGVVISESMLKIAKILYIAIILDIRNIEVFRWFVFSWRPLLFILPICVPTFFLIPESAVGDIILSIIFVITTAIPLFFIPSVIGGKYETELYPKILMQLSKLNKNRK